MSKKHIMVTGAAAAVALSVALSQVAYASAAPKITPAAAKSITITPADATTGACSPCAGACAPSCAAAPTTDDGSSVGTNALSTSNLSTSSYGCSGCGGTD